MHAGKVGVEENQEVLVKFWQCADANEDES